ncbi:hypothetical protein [Absidia glauca]|uniref:SPX domain-containing protein n=1 Tax=Absidia glauca TaxID=4829 RepID=A0A168LQJ5_ABSGL|nr:hypothetical protein [Absidia glauca]
MKEREKDRRQEQSQAQEYWAQVSEFEISKSPNNRIRRPSFTQATLLGPSQLLNHYEGKSIPPLFGKHIQSQQLTEWSTHYLDYKGLKKFISKLLNMSSEELAIAGLLTCASPEEDRAKLLQSQKAAFFFKLERELEKINSFYLQKENELKIRLRTLIDKKKILQSDTRRLKHAYTLLNAIQEAFIQFEQELNKIQKYIELNNEGFRKILKKWDKRSKSSTKELYLSRQIDIQPCFNTLFLCELADLASANRIELSDIQAGIPLTMSIPLTAHDPTNISTTTITGTTTTAAKKDDVMDDFEFELVKAVSSNQGSLVREILDRALQHPIPTTTSADDDNDNNYDNSNYDDRRDRLSRVFWHACSEGSDEITRMLINTNLINYGYVDDINERSCLHVAAMAGRRELMELCARQGANVRGTDVYGRTALHYATMNGFSTCVSYLLSEGADIESRDHDGFSPLVYAIVDGHQPCVAILLDAGADIEPNHEADHIPLSLACHCGHTDIALMLYHRGAKNLPNAESLYPLHIVARQGHQELCRLLAHSDAVDVPDKYNSWTPLFWAASDGHAECVRILVAAGAKVDVKDENGKTALYYAAWEGYMDIVQLLIDTGCEPGQHITTDDASLQQQQQQHQPPPPPPLAIDPKNVEAELDTIPSLSLPPPIIPFRIYGHNYLDRKYQVQICLRQPPIRLYDNTQISSLKLMISSNPDTGIIPHSVILPLANDREIFSFQVDKLDDFFLEFDIFATFGSKVLGRGVALPLTFNSVDFKIPECHCTIPLLDSHLKVIGELNYDYSVVKPFRGVQLEIGGRIETYWKSTNTVLPSSTTHSRHSTPEPVPSTLTTDTSAIATTAAVTSLLSTGDLTSTPGATALSSSSSGITSFITASSLSGDYVRAVVQLTKDLIPVVYANWLIEYNELLLAVSDLTYHQFCQFGAQMHQNHSCSKSDICSATGNSMVIENLMGHSCFVSLDQVLKALPSTMGIHLELKYPSVTDLNLHSFHAIADRNTFVDTILQCIYNHVRSLPSHSPNPSLFFSSFNSAICTVVNWKQPNYAVFYNTCCGLNKSTAQRGIKRRQDGTMQDSTPPSLKAQQEQAISGTSLKEAVKFAKRNNLLGIISDAFPLVLVPSLIKNIKESGLILVTFGRSNEREYYRRVQEQYGVDAMVIEQVVHFNTTMAGAGF